MSTSFEHALMDAVSLLRELPHHKNSIENARARFKRFSTSHRDVRCDLLVDQQPGSREADYDVLMGAPDGGTVALSWRPDNGIPGGVQYADHWAANYVLTVNERHTSIQSALIYLNTVLKPRRNLMEDLINRLLIERAIDEAPPPVSRQETERAIDDFRRSQGLYTAAATRQWLDEMCLTMEALGRLVANNVRTRKFKRRVTADKVRPFYEAHRKDFDVLTILRVQVSSKARTLSLAKAAARVGLWKFLQKRAGQLPTPNAQIATMYARELPPEFGSASLNTIVRPQGADLKHWMGQLLRRRAARFDQSTRASIEELLFQDWLADRRSQATIRWHWV
jgi:putative peptide maturation system protein